MSSSSQRLFAAMVPSRSPDVVQLARPRRLSGGPAKGNGISRIGVRGTIATAIIVLTIGIGGPAQATATFPASGSWDCDIAYATYTASSSTTLSVEGHFGGRFRAVIQRNVAGKLVNYYGAW